MKPLEGRFAGRCEKSLQKQAKTKAKKMKISFSEFVVMAIKEKLGMK